MLYIDDKKLNILNQNIYVGEFINNGVDGYHVGIQLKFVNVDSKEKGYLNLDVGFEKENDIKNFLNKEYCGIPFDNDDQFIFFEVFDTEKFLDTEFESKIFVKIRDLKNNQVGVSFELDDELLKIKYDGYLDIGKYDAQ